MRKGRRGRVRGRGGGGGCKEGEGARKEGKPCEFM